MSLKSIGYETHVMCLNEETMMKLPRTIRYEITREDRSWTKWDLTIFLERLWCYLKTCEEIEPTESTRTEQLSRKRHKVNATTQRHSNVFTARVITGQLNALVPPV